ncbi:hypothetical protein [Pseudactinotalea suaedae]|uniref:hypothetical protein n=1 Tax=Pseudactinotalea suaedae TaxID=1524924 RepID=UPI0012E2D306|nr:hypothetical protein [Pseudactinotalea suaedae]
MNDGRSSPPELVIRPTTPRWHWWLVAGVLVLLLVFHVVEGVELVHEGLRVGSVLAYLVWVVMTALVAIYLVGSEPLQVRISSEGMTWRGLGWVRTRAWSDLAQVGRYRHDLGAGGHWIAAHLGPEAPRTPTWAFP